MQNEKQKKPFVAIVPVFNARYATELTLRTLMAIGRNVIKKIVVIDSSTEQNTKDMLLELAKDSMMIELFQFQQNLTHIEAILEGLAVIPECEYVLLSDSDVEYHDGQFFLDCYELFCVDPSLLICGEYCPQRQDEPRQPDMIIEERIAPWVAIIRSDILKQNTDAILKKGVFPQEKKIYDVLSYFFIKLCAEGEWGYKKLTPCSYTHYGTMSWWNKRQTLLSPEAKEQYLIQIANIESNILNKIDEKIWLKLNAVDLD